MAKRVRDHKAEYARRKAKAQASGYKSVRQYKTARKTLALPRNESVTDYKSASRQWSKDHSRLKTSRFNSNFKPERVTDYYNAYVRPYKTRAERLDAIHDYLMKYNLITEDEWKQNYGLKAE